MNYDLGRWYDANSGRFTQVDPSGLGPDSNGEWACLYGARHRFLTEAASSRQIDGVLLQRLAGHESLSMTSRNNRIGGAPWRSSSSWNFWSVKFEPSCLA